VRPDELPHGRRGEVRRPASAGLTSLIYLSTYTSSGCLMHHPPLNRITAAQPPPQGGGRQGGCGSEGGKS
jgi:hypothetical protein